MRKKQIETPINHQFPVEIKLVAIGRLECNLDYWESNEY